MSSVPVASRELALAAGVQGGTLELGLDDFLAGTHGADNPPPYEPTIYSGYMRWLSLQYGHVRDHGRHELDDPGVPMFG